MSISLDQYFGPYVKHPDAGPGMWANAEDLLDRVNSLLQEYTDETGNTVPINFKTNSQVSGDDNGGFRPKDCPVGAPHSSHKEARAVDVKDPAEKLDEWLDTFEVGSGNKVLAKYGLYREAPDYTVGWCHLTTRAPLSMKRTFKP